MERSRASFTRRYFRSLGNFFSTYITRMTVSFRRDWARVKFYITTTNDVNVKTGNTIWIIRNPGFGVFNGFKIMESV